MTAPRASRRWLAGALLVTAGFLASPGAVPVYDGIGQPDEPYRFVAPPKDGTTTAEPTSAKTTTPVKNGRGTNGMSVSTAEVGPQFSLFLPPQSLAAAQGPITVTAEPLAPTDQPPGARLDGNVYEVAFEAPSPVTTTEQIAIATVYMRATTDKQPPPVLRHRATASDPWTSLKTSRGGQDIYVAAFPGPGQFAVAFNGTGDDDGGGPPVLWLVLAGLVLVVVLAVLVVRLRGTAEE